MHTVEIVDHRHATPAYAKGGLNAGLGPFKDLFQLVPIGHLFEREVFDGRACDDQTVEFLAAGLHLLEGAVKLGHVFGSGIAGLVFGHPDQRQFDLNRGCPQQTRKLVLCLDFLGHQVQQPKP